jgi:hypothetical protein
MGTGEVCTLGGEQSMTIISRLSLLEGTTWSTTPSKHSRQQNQIQRRIPMPKFTVTRCEPTRTFAKKDGSGEGQMQKVTLKSDDDQREYRTTLFSPDEAFVGDVVEATMKNYNEKFKEYNFILKAILATPRALANTPTEPTFSVEPKNRAPNRRSQSESLAIVRQSSLRSVAGLYGGKEGIKQIGFYIGLADQMTEWVMTSSVTPRVSDEEMETLVKRFGSEEGARSVAMGTYNIPFLPLLTKAQYDVLMDGSERTSSQI